MPDPRAQRTLVKSPPELWAEISDPEALTRHLGEFGEIRITRLDPETTVAWEGDRVRGTVELEASGWGTKVTLTATPSGRAATEGEEEPPPAAAPAPAAAPPPAAATAPSRRPSLLQRFRRRPRGTAETAAAPPAPAPDAVDRPGVERVLTGALDELGSASRRPFL
jgi:hypothetical protein